MACLLARFTLNVFEHEQAVFYVVELSGKFFFSLFKIFHLFLSYLYHFNQNFHAWVKVLFATESNP